MSEQNADERLADLERREAALRTDRMRFELTQALSAAKCRDEGLADAVTVMAAAITPTFDGDGRLTEIALGDETYASAAEAAQAFLESRRYLLDSGTGHKRDQELSKETKPSQKSPERLITDAFANGKQPPVREVAPAKLPKGSLTQLLELGYNASDLAREGWSDPAK